MTLSIVIPAWNEEKLLPATLRALAEAAAPLEAAGIAREIIVCDNNSSDATAAVAAAAGAIVVFEPINQISRARNTGAAAASGDWLLFLDADSTPSQVLMRDLAAALLASDVLYGGCTIRMDVPRPGADFFVDNWHRLARWRRWAAGSFLFVRRDAFHEVGGFSTEFFAAEEIDLSRRLATLADRTHRRFVFLDSQPLVTSSRKLAFRTAGDHLRFMLRTALTGGRTLRRRDSCPIWYDGRR